MTKKIHMEDIVRAIEKLKKQPTTCRLCDVMLLITHYAKPSINAVISATEILRIQLSEDENASE